MPFLKYTPEKNITLSELVCIGCDRCPTNTRKYKGIIQILEGRLGRPLQWVICQLLINELPLRHLFDKLDGNTTRPNGFIGPIGKSLTCHTLKICKI